MPKFNISSDNDLQLLPLNTNTIEIAGKVFENIALFNLSRFTNLKTLIIHDYNFINADFKLSSIHSIHN